MRLSAATGCLIVMLLAPLMGCGSRTPTLHGTVTVDGQPAPAGISLEFAPTEPGTPAYATTDTSGHYEAMLTFQKRGIGLGEHRVRLMPGSGAGEQPAVRPELPKLTRPKTQFPERAYRILDTIDVKPGRNRYDIDLRTDM